MGLFRKKPDLISERARALTDEIAALEAEIQQLNTRAQRQEDQPRLRSTAVPQAALARAAAAPASDAILPEPPKPKAAPEPIFEEIDLGRLQPRGEAPSTPQHYNELGVRKYDLPALMRRVRNHLRGPSTTNPKLVSYLAAGGIQGLRPLRYEKRVARNRFIVFFAFLFLVMLGLITVFVRGHR